MTPILRSSFAVRARRVAIWLAPALALVALAGCGKHKQSVRYRPIMPAPAGVIVPAAPCPSGDCGGSVSTVPAVTPGFGDPSLVTSPPPSPFGAEPVRPAGGGAGGVGVGEPGFDPNPTGGSTQDFGTGPALEAPRSSMRPVEPANEPSPTSRRRAVGGNRRSLLRRDVQAFVNDPEDFFAPPRAERPWRYVVLHHSAHPAGGLGQIDRDHRDRLGTDGCGYHFVVGNGTESPDGLVEVARRWSEQKAGVHCRDCPTPEANEYGIGICLVGNFEDAPPSARQVEAARVLVAYLQDRFDIPAENVRVHNSLSRSATACPGRHFPSEAILADLSRPLVAR